MNTELQTLKARLQQLEEGCAQMKTQYAQSERRYQNTARRLRVQAALAFCAVIGAILVSPANRSALAQGYGITLQQLLARMTVVEGKTQFMSADSVAKSTTFTGCNVIINDGGGSTSAIVSNANGDGLGNLIIGYNRAGNQLGGGDIRTGVHNLILGDGNNYLSYGGMVVGFSNMISQPYASVSGGVFNDASGFASSVSGGSGNGASGVSSSVSGGYINLASGTDSWVSAGEYNTASGGASSVSGGNSNTANSTDSSVSGGYNNTASSSLSSVSGGSFITQSHYNGWSGGSYHTP